MWLVLSNFFKYDIALTFWITLSFLFFIKYRFYPSSRNFFLACIFSGLAFAVKVSAIPLIAIIPLAHFLFNPKPFNKYKDLAVGVFLYLLSAVFFGLPDIVFQGRSMYDYVYSNIISGPQYLSEIYKLDNSSLFALTVLHKLPAMFGHTLYFLSIPAVIFVVYLTFKDFRTRKFQEFKLNVFILLSFLIFSVGFIPLGLTISANRVVVLLPLILIIDGIAIQNLLSAFKNKIVIKRAITLVILSVLVLQIFESYLWVQVKVSPLPEVTSSDWIIKQIPSEASIGLENVPIYQFEPDFILKEFYDKQYHPNIKTRYYYFIVDKKTKKLPKYIILSNIHYEKKYLTKSDKNDLVRRILADGYHQIAYFPLTIPFYKYFDSEFYFPFLGLFTYPDGITIFKK